MAVFALLFFMATASRLTSAGLLASQREPQPPRSSARPTLSSIFNSLTDGANGRLLLYLMAAQAAAMWNPILKAFKQRLRAAGKKPKVAVVAVMRKLIVTLNAMVRDNAAWRTVAA